jgi:Protein of unknown function (DUF1566)/Repeat of unknown function (DUF5648)
MRQLFKSICYSLICLSFTLLVACGGQEPKVETAQATKTTSAVAVASSTLPASTDPLQNGTSTSNISTPLLASLALLYPNGKMPENMAAEAAKQLAQSPRAFKNTGRSADLRLPSSFNTTGSQQPQSLRNGDGLYTPIYRYLHSELNRQINSPASSNNYYGTYSLSKFARSNLTSVIDPNYLPEGPVFEVAEESRAGLSPVYRFRNKFNNTQIETIDPEDRDYILTDPNLVYFYVYEGIAWYASKYSYSGWVPLYSFYNEKNGSYLYTTDPAEANVISNSYSQVFTFGGFAYYVKELSPSTPTTYVSIYPKVATQNVKTDFVVEGVNVPLDAQLSFPSLACETPTNRTSTGFSQKCTIGSGTSALGTIKSNGGAKQLGYRQIELVPAIIEPIYTGNLPDSGIGVDHCYGAGSDMLISCTSAAAIALNPKQDGMVGRDVTSPAAADGKLGFSYSNVPKPAGGVFAKTECVKDNVTGLMWEGRPNTGVRSNQNLTNFNSTTEPQKWDVTVNALVTVTQAEIDAITNSVGYQSYVNSIALCGYTDWRMPSIDEVDTLIDTSNMPFAHLDITWFPNSALNIWSRTALVNPQFPGRAWLAINSGEGSLFNDSRYSTHGVRLVRGGVSEPVVRYNYINEGAEVIDSKTGLIWKRCAEGMAWNGNTCIGTSGVFTHEAALAQALSQTGWRLPNRKELGSLADRETINTAQSSAVFLGTTLDSGFWSASPDTFQPQAWVATLSGYVNFGYRSGGGYVRLVRNAP